MESEESCSSFEEACIARQRKEKKDLQARIQQMKNSVPKGDKKRKKEIIAQIAILEAEQNACHEEELQAVKKAVTVETTVTQDITEQLLNTTMNDADGCVSETGGNMVKKMNKAQRRKEKKVQKSQLREELIKEQDVLNEQGSRHIEAEKLQSLLRSRGLMLSEVPSDGNCLFSAIEDQLQQLGVKSSIESLRCQTAQYIRNNPDDFLPFLVKEDTGDMYSPDELEIYCDRLEKTTEWGGQAEIRALAEVLKAPVEVIQATGPVITIGDNFLCKPLIIVYHRHQFGLGEHYNSVRPMTSNVNGFVKSS